MNKLFKSIAVITIFSVLTRGLGFLFRIFLSRSIGAEGMGIYQISFSVFMVLETFVSSGLPLIVSKYTSKDIVLKNKKSEYSNLTAALIIGLVTAVCLCTIVFVFKNLFSLLFTDKRCINILLCLMPSLVFCSVYSVIRGNVWGHRKYFLVSFTEFVEQLVRVIFCVIFFNLINTALDGMMIASLSLVFSCALSMGVVLAVYFKIGGRFSNPKGKFAPIIKNSIPITLVRVLSSLLSPLISIIIPLKLVSVGYTNEQALSVFGVAMGMTFPLLYIPSTIIGSLSMTLIPDLSSAASLNNFSEIKSKINFSIKFGLFVAFMFVFAFFAIGEQIGIFLYSDIQSGIFLSQASWLVVPICLSGITTSCLNALNLETKGFLNYCIGAIFLILCIVFLTSYVGIMSLVYGMGLCLGIATVLNIKMLNRRLNDNFFNFDYAIKILLCSIPSALITKWSFAIFSKVFPLFFSIAFSGILGEAFFLILALVFNLYNLSAFNLKNIISKRTANKNISSNPHTLKSITKK